MKKLILLTAAVLMTACSPAPDTDNAVNDANDTPIPYVTAGTYTCTPSNFTLEQAQVLDTGAEYTLNGMVDAPTPGYTYAVTEQAQTGLDKKNYTIRFTGPLGMVTQVITPVTIDYNFSAPPVLSRLKFDVTGLPTMQSESIVCERDII